MCDTVQCFRDSFGHIETHQANGSPRNRHRDGTARGGRGHTLIADAWATEEDSHAKGG